MAMMNIVTRGSN